MPLVPHDQDPLMNPRIKVGTFNVPITITNPTTGAATTLSGLVDTGATLTIAPASQLQSLGIEPTSTQLFEIANGQRIRYQVGEARVTVQGLTAPTLVVFGPEGVDATLGVVVLEMVGLTIDPRSRTLTPTELLMR